MLTDKIMILISKIRKVNPVMLKMLIYSTKERWILLTNPITFWYKKFKRELYTFYYILIDPATPSYFKILPIIIFIAYLVFPFDLIPDVIPFIGYVDDVVFLLIGISFVTRFIPTEILERCRRKAEEKMISSHLMEWMLLIFILFVTAIGVAMFVLIQSLFF